MSNSLWLHGLQHARPPRPSPSSGICSNSSIDLMLPSNHLILWCSLLLLPSIFSSIRVFSNELVLHISWPNIGGSPSAIVLAVNIQGWCPLGLTGFISLLSKGLSKVFSSTTGSFHVFFFPFKKNCLIYFNSGIITLQYCDGFCYSLTWTSHGCTCVPPSWTTPPRQLYSPPHPSGLSQSTGFECPALYITLVLVIYFLYGNIHVSMPFSQIIPP